MKRTARHGAAPYVPLRVHSHYSLLGGVGSPAEHVARAAELGLDTLGATESDGLYGALAWARAGAEHGVRIVLGVELTLRGQAPAERVGGPEARAIFLADGLAGYRALCRLVSAYRLRRAEEAGVGASGSGVITPREHDLPAWEVPAEELPHLFTLVDDPRLLARWSARAPRGRLFAALSTPRPAHSSGRHGSERGSAASSLLADPRKGPDPAPPRELAPLLEAARQLELPCAVAEAVWYPRPSDVGVHRRAVAIKHAALERSVRGHAADAWLRGAEEMAERWREHPEALANTRRIAEACRLELPVGEVHFPRCPLPSDESSFSRLWNLAHRGANRRYRPMTPEASERLERELRVIHALGFADYFLLVKRIRDFAAERSIPCVGRGSAADSLVAYALELTDADPLRFRLPFERFLNPARSDRPDIDLDFCWRGRDEVLGWVYESFGAERTAMICTFHTFGLRAAFRETAKVAGLPPHEVDRWSRALPYGIGGGEAFDGTVDAVDDPAEGFAGPAPERPGGGVLAVVRATPECRGMPYDREPMRSVLLTADRLLGAPRHLGLHPGGVVVAPSALTDFLPLERAAKGVVMTQFDKDEVEEVGLVKMDLLGNRGLTTLRDAVELVARRPGSTGAPELEALPEDDPATAALLAAGDTIGCFQVESPAMRTLLKQLGAADMDRVIQSVALIRPGPAGSGMKEAFVRRCRGLEEVRFPHPALAEVLAETFGVMLYQEDVLFVAQAIAGMDLAEADQLRRAMKRWRDPDAMDELAQRFVDGARQRGIDAGDAVRIWRLVSNFGNFSFCKAHAVTYGRLAYRAAWLKTHHPLEFLCAFLNSDTGYYETRVYIEEVRRRGFAILPPDVNRSTRGFGVEYPRAHRARRGDPGPTGRMCGALRVGLASIRGLRDSALDALLAARAEDGPFLNLGDLLERVDLDRRETEALVRCGALDGFERTRPEMLWRLRLILGATPRAQGSERRETAEDEPRSDGPRLRAGERSEAGHAATRAGERRFRERAGWDHAEGNLLFPAPRASEPVLPALPEWDEERRCREELELLGFSASHHPLDFFAAEIAAHEPVPCGELARHHGRRVTLVGWLVTSRRTRTEKGEWMRFLSLEDRSGVAETILFPDVYRRYGHLLQGLGPYVLRGVVEGEGELAGVDEHGLPDARGGAPGACTLRVEAASLLTSTGDGNA